MNVSLLLSLPIYIYVCTYIYPAISMSMCLDVQALHILHVQIHFYHGLGSDDELRYDYFFQKDVTIRYDSFSQNGNTIRYDTLQIRKRARQYDTIRLHLKKCNTMRYDTFKVCKRSSRYDTIRYFCWDDTSRYDLVFNPGPYPLAGPSPSPPPPSSLPPPDDTLRYESFSTKDDTIRCDTIRFPQMAIRVKSKVFVQCI